MDIFIGLQNSQDYIVEKAILRFQWNISSPG